jgi:ApaG protein
MGPGVNFFYRITEGIRVTARPVFSPEHSVPGRAQYVFIYHIRIENVGDQPAQLLRRHWHIHDPIGGDQEVEGEGVIGEQPELGPGEVHEYQSYCVLRGPSGYMEGHYELVRADGTPFHAAVPRFLLEAAAVPPLPD